MRTAVLFFFFILAVMASFDSDDPYEVLGVKKSATQREIKKAYHRLSRRFHPDRNRDDPDANDRFSKINEAYEMLSDAERRQHFDAYGKAPTGAPDHGFRRPGQGSFFFHHGDPFEFMFNGFGGGGGQASDSLRITRRLFEQKLVPESVNKPVLILAKAHMCFQCGPISQLWSRLTEEMENAGVTMATAYLDEPGGLAEALRLSSVPAIVGLANRRLFNYASYEKERDVSIASLVSFVRKMLPNDLVESVTDDNLAQFTDGFTDGRIRVLMGYSAPANHPRPHAEIPPPLRFVLAAFRHRHRARFGALRIDKLFAKNTQFIFDHFHLPRIGESLSILDENYEKNGAVYNSFTNPGSSGQSRDISAAAIDMAIQKHGFLSLPRIFSNHIFSVLCPAESELDADSSHELTLCVTLLADKKTTQYSIETFRKFGEQFNEKFKESLAYKLRFVYIYSQIQTGFAQALRQAKHQKATGQPPGQNCVDVVVLKQRDPNDVSFEYLECAWDAEHSSAQDAQLEQKLLKYKEEKRFNLYARIPELLDENREGLFRRIWWKLSEWADRLRFSLTSSDAPMFYASLFCTVIVGVGSILLHSVLAAFRGVSSKEEPANSKHPQVDQHRMLNVKMFCAETCDSLVRDLPRGEISIILLTTRQLQPVLLSSFVNAIAPFTKYHR